MKQNDLAEFYGVDVRTIRRWKSSGAPLDNPQRMVGWLLSRKRIPNGAVKWLETQQKAKPAAESPVVNDEDSPLDSDAVGSVKPLEDRRIELDRNLDLAIRANDHGQIKLYGELLVRVDESLRRSEAHQKKLGLDQGETLGRMEVERILRALSYAGNACIEGLMDEICERVVAFDYPEEAYHFLKPILLGGRLFAGFARVEKVPGLPNVPTWVSAAMRAEADQYLDNAEAIWAFCDTKFEKGSSSDGKGESA